MTTPFISSKDNPWYKKLKQLASDNTSYRAQKRVWIEGEHLCQAAIERGIALAEVVLSESVSEHELAKWHGLCENVIVISDNLMRTLSALPSPAWIGAVLELPSEQSLSVNAPTVVLDRLQDPGNAGSILRSAAAFGFKQVITTPGSVALWSAKVVRSAMGAHFGLKLFESIDMDTLIQLKLPVLITSSHQGQDLHKLVKTQQLPMPCMWVMGHEGQGVDSSWLEVASMHVRIAQPGGEESLNVAAAAAICLHASATQ